MSFRRLLAGLALVAVVIVAIVLVARGGEEPKGTTDRGERGFPVRGSLAQDNEAIDGAVAAWREEIAEDEAESKDDDDGQDAEERTRAARRPDPDDDISVLWIGRADDDLDVAILRSVGLVAELKRDHGRNWFLSGESIPDRDFEGDYPIEVGDSVLVPDGVPWHYVNTSFSSGYEDAGDGLFKEGGGLDADGFFLPQTPVASTVAIHITGVGGRVLNREEYERFTAALGDGYGRAIWLAADEVEQAIADNGRLRQPDDPPQSPPQLAVIWTGRVPEYAHAAAVLQGQSFAGPVVATLGYGETPEAGDRSEDRDEGAVRLGIAPADRRNSPRHTFVAGAYTQFHDVPYLVLAGAGAVKTLHASVGGEEITRKAPLAVIDARRFASDESVDTVISGRTADGHVVAPLPAR